MLALVHLPNERHDATMRAHYRGEVFKCSDSVNIGVHEHIIEGDLVDVEDRSYVVTTL